MTRRNQAAFTLIELLVVVSIIVVLVSMLLPALESAYESARRARCLANQRSIAMAMATYAGDQRACYPDHPGASPSDNRSSYDLREVWWGSAQTPAGMGQLVAEKYLPSAQLGQVLHCPSLHNLQSGGPGIGMDRPWGGNAGAGGSAWNDPAFSLKRILASFHWRGASWMNFNKTVMRTYDMSATQVTFVDLADTRFGGRWHHPFAYNRSFGDLSGATFEDPLRRFESLINTYTGGRGYFSAWHQGSPADYVNEERLAWPFLATQK